MWFVCRLTIFASFVRLDMMRRLSFPVTLWYGARKLLLSGYYDPLSMALDARIYRAYSASNICIDWQGLEAIGGLDVGSGGFGHGPDNLFGIGCSFACLEIDGFVGEDDKVPLSLGLFRHW